MPNTMREFQKFYNSIFGDFPVYDFRDKKNNIKDIVMYMLNRTQSMFKWSGLPDTIPQRNLELLLQGNGCAAFYPVEGNLYAFGGGLGGKPNPYYMPTIFTIANPALNISVNAQIDTDCIVMPNDSMYKGLLPIFSRYATYMVENELSLYIALVNSRIISIITSDNDNTTKSAEKYMKDIEEGKLGVIGTKAFLEGIKAQPFASSGNTNNITNLIESMQYYKASFFNEIGLNANYNMKRESINSGESQLNNDALLPLIDDMLRNRKDYAEKVNDKFGTSISVEFNSSWEDNAIELEKAQESEESEESEDIESENDI